MESTSKPSIQLSQADIEAIAEASMSHLGYRQSAPRVTGNSADPLGRQTANAEDDSSGRHAAEQTEMPMDKSWLSMAMSVAIPAVIALLHRDYECNQASTESKKSGGSDAICTAGEVARAFIVSKGYQPHEATSLGNKDRISDVFELAISVALSFLQGRGYQASKSASEIDRGWLSDATNIAAQIGSNYLQSKGDPSQRITSTQ